MTWQATSGCQEDPKSNRASANTKVRPRDEAEKENLLLPAVPGWVKFTFNTTCVRHDVSSTLPKHFRPVKPSGEFQKRKRTNGKDYKERDLHGPEYTRRMDRAEKRLTKGFVSRPKCFQLHMT